MYAKNPCSKSTFGPTLTGQLLWQTNSLSAIKKHSFFVHLNKIDSFRQSINFKCPIELTYLNTSNMKYVSPSGLQTISRLFVPALADDGNVTRGNVSECGRQVARHVLVTLLETVVLLHVVQVVPVQKSNYKGYGTRETKTKRY